MVAEKKRRRAATVTAVHRPARTTPSAPVASPRQVRERLRMMQALFGFSFLTTLGLLYLSEFASVQQKQLSLTQLERQVRQQEQQAKDLERDISHLQLSLPVTLFVHERGMVRTGSNMVVVETDGVPSR